MVLHGDAPERLVRFVVEYTNTIGKSMDAATMAGWKIIRN